MVRTLQSEGGRVVLEELDKEVECLMGLRKKTGIGELTIPEDIDEEKKIRERIKKEICREFHYYNIASINIEPFERIRYVPVVLLSKGVRELYDKNPSLLKNGEMLGSLEESVVNKLALAGRTISLPTIQRLRTTFVYAVRKRKTGKEAPKKVSELETKVLESKEVKVEKVSLAKLLEKLTEILPVEDFKELDIKGDSFEIHIALK